MACLRRASDYSFKIPLPKMNVKKSPTILSISELDSELIPPALVSCYHAARSSILS